VLEEVQRGRDSSTLRGGEQQNPQAVYPLRKAKKKKVGHLTANNSGDESGELENKERHMFKDARFFPMIGNKGGKARLNETTYS